MRAGSGCGCAVAERYCSLVPSIGRDREVDAKGTPQILPQWTRLFVVVSIVHGARGLERNSRRIPRHKTYYATRNSRKKVHLVARRETGTRRRRRRRRGRRPGLDRPNERSQDTQMGWGVLRRIFLLAEGVRPPLPRLPARLSPWGRRPPSGPGRTRRQGTHSRAESFAAHPLPAALGQSREVEFTAVAQGPRGRVGEEQ